MPIGQQIDSPLNPDSPATHLGPAIGLLVSLIMTGLFTGKPTGRSTSWEHVRKCGAVYDRSEHIAESREISSFECAVCGKTIENWNSAWVPRYRFIACPASKSDSHPKCP